MATYRFFPAADKSQDEIWNYTYEQWGETQADAYITGLHVHIQNLADRKLVWRKIPASLILPPDLDMDIYYSRYEKHHLFFRALSGGVLGVMSILHEARDLPVRLRADLKKIDEIGKE